MSTLGATFRHLKLILGEEAFLFDLVILGGQLQFELKILKELPDYCL